jgi:UPF0755 protein
MGWKAVFWLRRLVAVVVLLALLGGVVLVLDKADDRFFGSSTSSSTTATTRAATRTLVVPEGFSIRDIDARAVRFGAAKGAVLAAATKAVPPANVAGPDQKPAGVEGFLFPASYPVALPVDPAVLVQQQLEAFGNAFANVDLTYAKSKNLTGYDVVKIASMIEREAGFPGDRPKIAAVIYNRLRRRMPLGIDATLQYANGSWAPLTAADLKRPGPYNTRLVQGLPPTPICNPGLAAMQAAAHPTKVGYLYYYAIPGDPKRRSYFTRTYAAMQAYIAQHPAK